MKSKSKIHNQNNVNLYILAMELSMKNINPSMEVKQLSILLDGIKNKKKLELSSANWSI